MQKMMIDRFLYYEETMRRKDYYIYIILPTTNNNMRDFESYLSLAPEPDGHRAFINIKPTQKRKRKPV